MKNSRRAGRAVTFAPSGKVVVSALPALHKGGVVAINAIHLDQMPSFDYDKLLWGERQIRSVANMTRQDARDFLKSRRISGFARRSWCSPCRTQIRLCWPSRKKASIDRQ